MAIVKNAITIHGGTITVCNVYPHGLKFDFTLSANTDNSIWQNSYLLSSFVISLNILILYLYNDISITESIKLRGIARRWLVEAIYLWLKRVCLFDIPSWNLLSHDKRNS